jgi:hypothetical protein
MKACPASRRELNLQFYCLLKFGGAIPTAIRNIGMKVAF